MTAGGSTLVAPGTTSGSEELLTAVCRELVAIAHREEERAATEAAHTPYWQPCPTSVLAHRQAAVALRESALQLELEARARG